MSKPSWGIVILIASICGVIGGGLGFFIGVATSEFAKDLVAEINVSEEDAEIGNPRSFDGTMFGFEYPSNWTIDEDLAYDLDYYIAVTSPGGSYVVLDGDGFATDTEAVLQAEIAGWGDYVAGAQSSFFGTYGSYEGSGISMTFRSSGMAATFRIFCYSEGEISVTITEYVYEMDRDMIQPGFDLIERTMNLK